MKLPGQKWFDKNRAAIDNQVIAITAVLTIFACGLIYLYVCYALLGA